MKIEDALRLADREYDSDLTGSPLFPEACSTLARALLAANMRLVALYRTAAPRLARMVRALQNQLVKRGEP